MSKPETKPKTRHVHVGYDYFTPDPGTVEEMNCAVCGDKMDVKRNALGPTGFVEAMGGHKHAHDRFTCPNSGLDWHDQLIALDKELRKTSSGKIACLLREEILQVRYLRVCTHPAASIF